MENDNIEEKILDALEDYYNQANSIPQLGAIENKPYNPYPLEEKIGLEYSKKGICLIEPEKPTLDKGMDFYIYRKEVQEYLKLGFKIYKVETELHYQTAFNGKELTPVVVEYVKIFMRKEFKSDIIISLDRCYEHSDTYNKVPHKD